MPSYGYLPDSFDERDAWSDEVLAGSDAPVPKSYRTDGLAFEPQGAWPFCASFAVTKMVEHAVWKKTGIRHDLSQPHLFFNSGGTRNGSTFRGNLETARTRGEIRYAKFPMPDDLYDLSGFDSLLDDAKKTPFDGAKTILGYVRVVPDREALKRQILASGMVLVGVAANGGYWKDGAKRPNGKPDNHAVLLVGWDEDDSWWVFDSLSPRKGFDGYHRLATDYGFNSCYAVTELPDDWKEIVRQKREEPFALCLSHYGKPRDYEAEKRAAVEILDEFRKFKNQSVTDAAGKFYTVLINMMVYGGYSLSYSKWGKWMPGDLINMVYMYRRTGQLIFDPNKPRSEYK